MSTPARSAPAHNTAVLQALGLGHLADVTAVDVSLRPNQLPVAVVSLHPQDQAITYNLLRAEQAPAPELDLDALADQARMRVDCLLHQRAAHHRGNVREAFADARWRLLESPTAPMQRPTVRISVRSDRATADAPTRAHVEPKAYPLLPLDNPTHLHALRGGVAMALSLCGLIVWMHMAAREDMARMERQLYSPETLATAKRERIGAQVCGPARQPVWINDTTVRCTRTPPAAATATVVAKGGV